MTPRSPKVPGLKSYAIGFGGFCVYLDLLDTALQEEESFPETVSLEISPKGHKEMTGV